MFSIIIPVKEINDYVRETVPKILELDVNDWELLIVTNDPQHSEWPNNQKIKMLSSGRVGPAEKRDIAAKKALGEILVFLDDDSYPEPNLLSIANKHFTKGVVALGGPAITPPEDTFLQKVSGAVFSSRFTGGAPERYRPVGLIREVDDWPSVNLMIRKDVFSAIGGFDSPYWPGEDTFLCLKLLKAGHKVLYVPDLVVWHHRREGFLRHIKQVGAYGLHRGYFARHLPETSRRLQYFVPSFVMLLFLMAFLIPFVPAFIRNLLMAGVLGYLVAVIIGVVDLMRFEKSQIAISAFPYIIATHLSYGFWFLRGFLRQKELISRLR